MQTRRQIAIALLTSLLLAGCATTSHDIQKNEAPDQAIVTAARAEMVMLYRVESIHYKLAVAGESLCLNKQGMIPVLLQTNPVTLPPAERTVLWRVFGLDESIRIGVIVDTDAAPGVKIGQRLTSVTGEAASPGDMAAARKLMEIAKTESSVTLGFDDVDHKIALKRGCASYVVLAASAAPDSGAMDGRSTYTIPLVALAKSDDELAYIIAREVAMNGFGYADKVRYATYVGAAVNGAARGVFGIFGALLPQVGAPAAMKAARIAYEHDADKGAFALMVKAGFDPGVVPAFWERNSGIAEPVGYVLKPDAERKSWWRQALGGLPPRPVAVINETRQKSGATPPSASANAVSVVRVKPGDGPMVMQVLEK